MRKQSEKAGSQTRFPGTTSIGPAKSQLTNHRVRHLLVDGMVELRDALVRPVFTQLRKNLSQSIRPARVEPGGGVRHQAHKAKRLPVSETPASATAAAGGREGAGEGGAGCDSPQGGFLGLREHKPRTSPRSF